MDDGRHNGAAVAPSENLCGSLTMAERARLKRPELLAPAQDMACLQAAVNARCDAVYLGIDSMNMRSAARNFSPEDLPAAAHVCHAAGVRLYLAANTILYTAEIPAMRALLERAGGLVDAVICWDPAVIALCRELDHTIHISTQASVANVEAARFYQRLGATRIVPARECTLAELSELRDAAGIEVEAFIHGAMCVSYSGRCYLSQDVFNKSGNRGACLQPCRREYVITEVEEGDQYVIGEDYVMSAKDVCTMPFIEQLIEAGLDAFKIEGRNRNPEYVDVTVRCYRRAIDAYFAGTLGPDSKAAWMRELGAVFNRRFSDGFYHGRPIASFAESRGSQSTHRKEYVGVVTDYYGRIGVVEVDVRSNPFRPGDELMIIGPTTGVVYFQPRAIRQEDATVDVAPRGIVTMELGQKVRTGDKVYIRVPRDGKRCGEA